MSLKHAITVRWFGATKNKFDMMGDVESSSLNKANIQEKVLQ